MYVHKNLGSPREQERSSILTYQEASGATELSWPERMFSLGRSNSMELQNDPRFFTKNVLDKRLVALKTMTIVSSLMLGTALKHCFSIEKKYNFTGDWECPIVSGLQIFSFFILMRVVFVCFMSLYTFCQQLYHIYRLMTSGPTGVESAGEYYLHPIIVSWRHTAVNRLLKSLYLFVLALGFILAVKIMKDGGTIDKCYNFHTGGGPKKPSFEDIALVVNTVMRHKKWTAPAPPPPHVETEAEEFADYFQPIFAGIVCFSFCVCAYVLSHINRTHTLVFQGVYAKVSEILPSTRSWSQSSFIDSRVTSRA